LCFTRLQKSLHHRDLAGTLRIRAVGDARRRFDRENDAGAGPDGAANRAGTEGVGGAAAANASGRSARGIARHPAREAYAAAADLEREEAAKEASRASDDGTAS